MRAPPQSVPIMCGTEVGHPDASRPHQGDHFERRLEILCLAARSPMSGKCFFSGPCRFQMPRPAAAFSRKISPDLI